MEIFTPVTLADYHAKLLEAMGKNDISDYAARDNLQVVKQFIHWLWNHGAIESLTNNVTSKNLEIHVSARKIEPRDFEVLKKNATRTPTPRKIFRADCQACFPG